MTGPTPDEVVKSLTRNWEFTRDLADRVATLETKQAEDDAVSAWRHWAVPLALSALAVLVAVAGLLVPHHR